MIYFLSAFFSVIIYEIIKFSKFLNNFTIILKLTKKIIHTLLSKKISDHWKEKILLRYSLNIFLSSLKNLLILILILIIIFLINYFNNEFVSFLLSLKGLSIVSIYMLFYYKIRN